MSVKIGNKDVMAVSMYPKEIIHCGKIILLTVAETLKTYSDYTFDYPYSKAISVHAKRQGMGINDFQFWKTQY